MEKDQDKNFEAGRLSLLKEIFKCSLVFLVAVGLCELLFSTVFSERCENGIVYSYNGNGFAAKFDKNGFAVKCSK